MAKRFKARKIDEENYIIIWIFNDLDDELIEKHLQQAIDDEDYEYADAVRAEAIFRGINFKIRL